MQLHVCLLLFIITTDKTLALLHPPCGGNLSLAEEPAGHISLTSPESSRHTNSSTKLNCTWIIDVPLGQTIRLTLVQLDAGASISVHCVWWKKQVLDSSGTALLANCDQGRADIVWTGTANSTHPIQLSYFVQEDEKNSSEDHTSPHSDRDLIHGSPTGTSIPRAASVGQEVIEGTEGSRGPLYEGLGGQFVSSPSFQDQEGLHPTAPVLGLTVAGRGDRETLPLPEEEPNNVADTSVAADLADSSTSAGGRTHSYFHTQPTPSTDALSQPQNTPVNARVKLPHTPTEGANRGPPRGTDIMDHTSDPQTITPSLLTESSSTVPPHTSDLTSNTSLPAEVVSGARADSTEGLISDVTPTVTYDPLKSLVGFQQDDFSSDPTPSSSSHRYPSTPSVTERDPAVGTVVASFFHPNMTQTEASDVPSQTETLTQTETDSPLSAVTDGCTQSPPHGTSLPVIRTSKEQAAQAATESTQMNVIAHMSANTLLPSPDVTKGSDWILGFTGALSTQSAPMALSEAVTANEQGADTTSSTPLPFQANSQPQDSSTPEFPPQTSFSGTLIPLTSTRTESAAFVDRHTTPAQQTTHNNPSTSPIPALHKQSHRYVTTTQADLPSFRSESTEFVHGVQFSWTTPHLSQEKPSPSTPTTTQTPKFFVVPDQPASIRVESVELLLQIIVEEPTSASPAGLEEDTVAWVEPYLLRASGFSRLLGVWSRGHAVQSLLEFKTSGALQWLSAGGPTALMEQTGLAQAVDEGRSFRSSKITNITLGGLQGEVCDWLLHCPAGYKCVFQPATANHSCSSVCHFDYCHHHGICTHHPQQPPVCRCLVGEDFWFMGQRCDVRMTRARLVGTCLSVLLILVTVIAVLALVAVRRYRAVLIQAKVDQTRSSYRRFNHFDELSGRFWLRSLAGSADSLDNPAFTRSDELLHLRALDRPCCYHDDTLSLASTCPSHGTRINTIYPHSSQYGWRGSEMSVGDGVLDSGKASDLSVCSWPVEPIHWTPFPLLQQLASQRSPAVRVSRPRSYCEGMELVDLGKSWTA